jgi:hypothetical protein
MDRVDNQAYYTIETISRCTYNSLPNNYQYHEEHVVVVVGSVCIYE